MNKQYLTPEGAEKLKEELLRLEGPAREKLAHRLKSAIEMGDLSENADYIKAKEDQGFLEGRIEEIKYLLHKAEIIQENTNFDSVIIGAKVTIQEDDYEPEIYHLVGSKEASPGDGRWFHRVAWPGRGHRRSQVTRGLCGVPSRGHDPPVWGPEYYRQKSPRDKRSSRRIAPDQRQGHGPQADSRSGSHGPLRRRCQNVAHHWKAG